MVRGLIPLKVLGKESKDQPFEDNQGQISWNWSRHCETSRRGSGGEEIRLNCSAGGLTTLLPIEGSSTESVDWI